MSTLRTHKDYVKALAYAKEREQVRKHSVVYNGYLFLPSFIWSPQVNLYRVINNIKVSF